METTLPKPKNVRPCAHAGCDKLTRGKHVPPIEGTVAREGRGMCYRHYKAALREEKAAAGQSATKYPIQECTREGCDVMTRDSREHHENVKGLRTRRRLADGTCYGCYQAGNAEAGRSEDPEQTLRGLESFLTRRRDRLARQARAAQFRTAFGLAS